MTNKNERKHFKFYKSYYDVFCELPDKEKLSFIEAIFKKQFFNIDTELKWLAKFAYISQKHNIENQVQGFIDKMGEIDTPMPPPPLGGMQGGMVPPPIQPVTDNIQHTTSNKELDLAISEWMEYKKERKEWYKPMGLKTFISQCNSYIPETVIAQIHQSISNGWRWVIWDKCTPIPKFNTDYDFSTMTETEAFEIIKNNRKLVPQLEYQNPVAYKWVKFALNTLQEYGC